MSQDPSAPTTRREFLGAAAAATVATLAAPAMVEGAQSGGTPSRVGSPTMLAQAASAQPTAQPGGTVAAPATTPDWTRPAAIALPKEGYFEREEGRYGPVYPRTPANYGFTVIAKVKPGREAAIRDYGKTIEQLIKDQPYALATLKLHYLRWVLFDVGCGLHFMYQGIFDTDFDKYVEDAIALFVQTGVTTVFVNLEGFPEDWKTNAAAVIKFFRDHQRPSFLEYGEYPYVSADEVKKALKIKSALATMLDQMQ